MKPIFPKGIDDLKPVIFLTGAISAIGIILIFNFYFTDAHLSVGYKPDQPIPFSHRLHAGEMGIDCRYCHANVEKSPHATVPPSQICMNCHSQVKKDSPKLKPLYDRYTKFLEEETVVIGTGRTHKTATVKKENAGYKDPLPWLRIHNVPDYAYFDHSAHLRAGVGCASCHGRIDQMEVVRQVQSLSMGWCLECHRDPDLSFRPLDQVTNMSWTPPANQREYAAKIKVERNINPPTNCSGCHR